MSKICRRCGHDIPDGKVSFDIMYEPVAGKNNTESIMKKGTLCLFCAEAFERFMRNQPTSSVWKGNNKKKDNTYPKQKDIKSMNSDRPKFVYPSDFIHKDTSNVVVDPEIIKRQEFVQQFNKENG